MNNVWLGRFANVPALVAPHMVDRFQSSLLALDARLSTELAATQPAGDDFWTELGPRGSKVLRPYVVRNGILEIPVLGVLLHGFPYQLFDIATGYEYIAKALDRGLADDDVRGIVLIINSPGGMVAGNFDLVDRIYAGRSVKPIRAVASEFAYSAAYSIASACDTITLPRTGEVGSIGVVMMHVDVSAAIEDAGVKITFIFAGRHKVEGNAFEPLPDAVKASWQEDIDYLYGIFVDTVARNRGIDPAAVRATEADTFRADEAVETKLADKVGALDDALAEFSADLSNPDQGDETMTTVLTASSVKADHPDVAKALIDEGKAEAAESNKAAIASAVTAAVAADRTRIAGIDKLGAKAGTSAEAVKIIADAKADGSTPEATAMKLVEAGAFTKAAVLGAIQEDDAGAAGAAPAASGAGAGATAVPQTEEGWKAEYGKSDKLKAEFASEGDYVAFKKADQGGKVRMLNSRAAA